MMVDMIDNLGDRMKRKYENVFRSSLPQRSYGVLRIDGKAFHTFTKNLPKPHCTRLSAAMDTAAEFLCKEMMGCRVAYGQSDEYSFVFTDFEKDSTEMWFDGNVQKMASVSASIFTAHFNHVWSSTMAPGEKLKIGTFDSRVFVIPSRRDVIEYLVWRQTDASRNSLNMFASCHFSHKELMGQGSVAKHNMLHTKGLNWNDCTTEFKRGRVIRKMAAQRVVSYKHKKTGEQIVKNIEESVWTVDKETPVFVKQPSYLDVLIPHYEKDAGPPELVALFADLSDLSPGLI